MRKNYLGRMLSGLFLMLILCLAGTITAQGQFGQKRDTVKIDPSGFPSDIKKGYRLFGMKCGECHGLDTSLKPTIPASQWPSEVKRMQAMPSSQFNDEQAKAIINFLNYYEAHRESPKSAATQGSSSGTADAGRQFYETQGCARCHAIAGKGGTSGPSLSDVGSRLSRDQLAEVIRKGKSSMPPLPAGITDQQLKDLVDFLAGPSGEPQRQNGGAQKEAETPADQGAKPAVQAAPSGTESTSTTGTGASGTESKPTAQAVASGGGAGLQIYDKQRCANCHAIAGKGGTSGPSLNDVGKRLSKEQLAEVIRKGKSSMPALPAGITDQQLKDLVEFLVSPNPNGQPQKQNAATEGEPENPPAQESKPTAQAGSSATEPKATQLVRSETTASKAQAGSLRGAAAGRRFYDTAGCAKCHAISGEGGTSAPSLNEVGTRLSRDQLVEVIQKMRIGKSASMPPLPVGTTDQQANDLVDFLASLSKKAQKQTAGVQKEAATPTGQGSQPSAQAEPSGTIAAAGLSPSQFGEELEKLRAADTNGPTALSGMLLLFVIVVTAVVIGVLVFHPGLTENPSGKILAFLGLFILPLTAGWMGTTYHIDRSKSTKFCLSCHEMEPFGKSLLVNDSLHLAAAHFQNHRVPADEACYTCHTNYAMFGGIRAKLGGLKHVYVHYLGTVPVPEAIRLYEPFNNRECLHCHLGARSFEEGRTHNSNPYLLPALKGNQVSCLSCHKTVHNIAELDTAKFWKGTR